MPFQFNYIIHKTFELRSDNDNRIHVAAVQKPRTPISNRQIDKVQLQNYYNRLLVRKHIIYIPIYLQ